MTVDPRRTYVRGHALVVKAVAVNDKSILDVDVGLA